uniref:Ripped pocket, isoform B n=2 Tax=Drosophila melanogaster TaxID=7227 RepID=A0A0B4K691_DROME|nr:ripped pocket, isoform B [Drosophila melanogaster]AFH06228.1 ripped pocket, isoform B [Drosophila melanogaster]|eukprot:NP_001246909.1 ripped pocket, isoform B [Drosophila melanogaster]
MTISDSELDSSKGIDLTFRRRRKAGSVACEGFITTYHEYCRNTSIHGVQYLGEQERPFRERIFWLFVFLISIYGCSTLIQSAYTKWTETPVIVSFAEKSTPVWNIPFPAVTVCSETKRVLKQKGKETTYADLYSQFSEDMRASRVFRPENVSALEMEEFRTLLHVCNTQIIEEDIPLIAGDDLDYFDVLQRMLPQFDRYFFYCRWLSRFGECETFFRKTLTEEGICYTFNGLRATEIYRDDTYQYQHSGEPLEMENISSQHTAWTLETGYALDSDVETFPARVLSAGARSGIFLALQSFKQEVDYACRGPVQGFKVGKFENVLLHAPDDVPQVSKQFVRIPMGKEVLIAVKPNMITMSSGIAEYHPVRRQCFLSHERSLRFFKVYTESNCQLECLANFTLTKCGCVKFSMPRNVDMPVCGEDKIHCYDRAERELLVREFKRVKALNAGRENSRSVESACNCMPACTSLVYNTEISQANFDLEEMLVAEGDTEFLKEYPGSQMSRLSIYFKQSQFITSKRSELYGMTEFLANCGGIFGLFMGFSILSLVEMIYHFTLRLFTNLKRLVKG